MRKEMMFLFPPMGLAVGWFLLTQRVAPVHAAWIVITRPDWVTGFLGALFGGLIGAFVVWIVRILGSIAFGKQAMGMGDVDLMFGVGAVLGAGAATVAFFLAPFFGIVLAVYRLLIGKKDEVPYGPYLSMASGFVMLFYCPIADWLAPGLTGLAYVVTDLLGPS
jgi:leader peptidase (prepilin peptidase)/N-methyltransferase